MANLPLLYRGNRRGLIREGIRILAELATEAAHHPSQPIVAPAQMSALVLPLAAYLQSQLTVPRPTTPGGYVQVTTPGPQSSAAGATVSLQVQASDWNGAAITYSAAGLPPGLSINPATGLINGTVGAGDHTGSPYSVTVTAAAGGDSATVGFQWTV